MGNEAAPEPTLEQVKTRSHRGPILMLTGTLSFLVLICSAYVGWSLYIRISVIAFRKECIERERSRLTTMAAEYHAEELRAAIDESCEILSREVTPGRFQLVAAAVPEQQFFAERSTVQMSDPKPQSTIFLLDTSTGDVWRYFPGYANVTTKETVGPKFNRIGNSNLRPEEDKFFRKGMETIQKK